MKLSIYVALAAIAILAGYSASSALAASISSEQSTIVQQSSSSSSSTVTNDSDSVVSSQITSSSSSQGLSIGRDLSGKIASTQFNTTTGDIENVLFGDWSLDSSDDTTEFAANFTRTPFNGTGAGTEYQMNNLRLHSVQKINDSFVLEGMVDVSSIATELKDVPVTIMVHNGVMVIGFDSETEADSQFSETPIIGFVEEE